MELFDKNYKNDRSEIIYKIETLSVQIKEKDAQIQALLNSKSWLITSPLRKIVHQLRQIIRFIKGIFLLTSCLFDNRYRVLFFLKRSLQTIHQEGITALFSKIRRKIHKGSLNKGFSEDSYQEWIFRNDTLNEDDRREIQKRIRSFTLKPTFSIIMPVYNTTERFLVEAINSVKSQIYPHWELCIADDASTSSHIAKILNHARESDERIKVIYRSFNGHISQASNSALEMATGDFIVLLDHDDSLSETALYMVTEEINANPNVELIYSDEDKIDSNSKRFDPSFKPDWNFDLFMSYGYLCHLVVIKESIVKKAGGFRLGVEGAQDYDLLLRCLIHINDKQNIKHIPHILYHWRSYPGSTALSTNEKSYAHLAGLKSLKDFWNIKNPLVEVKDGLNHCNYRVYFPVPQPLPLVSILLASGGGLKILKRCMESIRLKTNYPNYEILVDNGNKDPDSIKFLEDLEKTWVVRIIQKRRPENFQFNYSKIINNLAEFSKGSILVLLNDDTEIISQDWLEEFVRQTSRPDIGVVGAKLLYPDGNVQHAGIILGVGGEIGAHVFIHYKDSDPGYMSRAQVPQNLSAVTGACIALRREIFFEVGGMEEDLAVTCNDVDLCLKVLQRGFRNLWTPYVKLYHSESATRGPDDSPEKKSRFLHEVEFMKKKWNAIIPNDPAYNPNLSFDPDGFTITEISRARKPWKKININNTKVLVNNGIKVSNRAIFKPIKKSLQILVVKLDHRGDMLSALPAFLRLREKFKDAEIDLICGPWNVPLVERLKLFRKIFPLNFFQESSISGINRKKKEESLFFKQLGEYDIAIDFRILPETRILFNKINSNFNVGYRSYSVADSLLDICLDGENNPSKHITLKLLELVEAIPFETFNFPKLSVNDKTKKKEIGIFPFAGSSARQWPLNNFLELVQKLSQALLDWKINVYFPPAEFEKTSLFKSDFSNVSLITTSSLEQVIDSVSGCEIVVSNDSFGSHLPGYLGNKISIVVFSGVVSVNDWRPALGEQKVYYSDLSCSPCYLGNSSDCPFDMLCLTQIPVNTILDAVILETKIDHWDDRNERLCYQIMIPND